MERMRTLAAAQLGPASAEKADTVKRMIRLMEQAADTKVDILSYPELALSPYFAVSIRDDWRQFFEDDLPSALTQPIFDIAKKAGISFLLPYAELSGGKCYNSSMFVDSDGTILGKYRKTHIPGFAEPQLDRPNVGYEKRYFLPGDLGFPVYQSEKAAVGGLICYDRRFGEGWRVLGLGGAEVVMVPFNTGFGNSTIEKGQEMSELCCRHGAYTNGLFVIACGKAGVEDGKPYTGGSCIIAPSSDILAKAKTDGDELVVATVNLQEAVEAQERWNFAVNRHPDQYGPIVEPVDMLAGIMR